MFKQMKLIGCAETIDIVTILEKSYITTVTKEKQPSTTAVAG